MAPGVMVTLKYDSIFFAGVRTDDPKAAARSMLSEPDSDTSRQDKALHAGFVEHIRRSSEGADLHLYLEGLLRKAFERAEAEAARARSVGEDADFDFEGDEILSIRPCIYADPKDKLYGVVSGHITTLVGAHDVEHAVSETIKYSPILNERDNTDEGADEGEDDAADQIRELYVKAAASRNGVFRGDGVIAIAPPHDGLYSDDHSVVIGLDRVDRGGTFTRKYTELIPGVISLCREASAIIDGDERSLFERAHALLCKANGLIYEFHWGRPDIWDYDEHPLLPPLAVAMESTRTWIRLSMSIRHRQVADEARRRASFMVGVVIRSAIAVTIVDSRTCARGDVQKRRVSRRRRHRNSAA